jgi:hypothetical protein
VSAYVFGGKTYALTSVLAEGSLFLERRSSLFRCRILTARKVNLISMGAA